MILPTLPKQGGGRVILRDIYSVSDTDFSTIIENIKNSRVDLVYLVPEFRENAVNFVDQFKSAKVSTPIWTTDVLLEEQALRKDAVLLEGIIGFEAEYNYSNPKASVFFSQYQSLYGSTPFKLYQAAAYDSVFLLSQGISVNGENPLKVRNWLNSLKNWQGTLGSVTFDENGDIIPNLQAYRIKNGNLTSIDI